MAAKPVPGRVPGGSREVLGGLGEVLGGSWGGTGEGGSWGGVVGEGLGGILDRLRDLRGLGRS